MNVLECPMPAAAFLIVLAAMIGCGSPGSHDEGSSGSLHEASMNFDLDTLGAFLPRVERLVERGFGPAESDEIMALAKTLDVNAEDQRQFQVVYGGRETLLRVQVVMDGVDAPDVYFFTRQELAKAITDEMIAFGEELGI
jgi:hypothetical protein